MNLLISCMYISNEQDFNEKHLETIRIHVSRLSQICVPYLATRIEKTKQVYIWLNF